MIYKFIVFLPLIGFLIAGLGGQKIGDKASQLITAGLVSVSAVLSWLVFIDVALAHNAVNTVLVLEWVKSGTLEFNWALKVDTLTVVNASCN